MTTWNFSVWVGDIKEHRCKDGEQANAVFGLLEGKVLAARRKKLEQRPLDFLVQMTHEEVKRYLPKGAQKTKLLTELRRRKKGSYCRITENIPLTPELCTHLATAGYSDETMMAGMHQMPCVPFSVAKSVIEGTTTDDQWNALARTCAFSSDEFGPYEVDGSLHVHIEETPCINLETDTALLCRDLHRAVRKRKSPAS
jgi:hypothetical protein